MTQPNSSCHALGAIAASNARAMLYKLCKHFTKKIAVEFDETRGLAHFPLGEAELRADDAQLSFACACDSEDKLAALCEIIDLHVALLTRREPRPVIWTRPT